MDYVQNGEILYIPGTMTPTEVRVDFYVQVFYRSNDWYIF